VVRDQRVAVHAPTTAPPSGRPSSWAGDAKLVGRLRDAGERPHHGYTALELDLEEAVWTHLDEDDVRLVVESWHPGTGWRRRTRA
jgi:hypothetical protein